MREYELRVAQKMSMKVSDLFLNNSERNTVSAKVLAAWLEIKPNRPPLYPFTMSTKENCFHSGSIKVPCRVLYTVVYPLFFRLFLLH